MKVEYSKRAVSDLRQIADYHRLSDNPVIGERIAVGINRAVGRIARAPLSGRGVVQRPGVRVVSLLRYRYLIFYRVAGDTIRILHIRHTSRRPWAGA